MYRKILVAYDASAGAKLALDHGIRLAKSVASKLVVIWVRGSLPHFPETVDEIAEETEAAEKYFARLKREVEDAGKSESIEIPCESVSGNAAKSIMSYAEDGAFDLIVLGNRGHSNLWGRVLGHTADRVSEHAHCDVLIVRESTPQSR